MDGNQTNLDGILTKYRTQQSFFAISFHFLGQFIFTPIPKGGGWCQTSDLTNFLAISSKTNFRLKKISPPPPHTHKVILPFQTISRRKEGGHLFLPS